MHTSHGTSRGRARRRRLLGGVLLSVALLVAACGDDDTAGDAPPTTTAGGEGDTTTGTSEDGSLVGPVDEATGDPVKVGFASDGQSAAGDSQVELDVADATVAYLNKHKAGIAGRPVELFVCTVQNDPGRATDCGNQMVEEEVSLVAVGATGVYESVWQPLHDAGIPTVFFATSGEKILSDPDSSFSLASPEFSNINYPISVAQEAGADKVTAVVIDVPAATDGFEPDEFAEAGLDLELVRVPVGTADMTPQLQGVVDNAGVVHIVGNDTFCISALQALEALAFDGPISMLNFCLSDATRQAFPNGFLEGISMPLTAPSAEDPASALFREVIEKFGTSDIDVSQQQGVNTFVLFAAIDVAVDGLDGDVTPESVIDAMRSMDETELPNGGGITFQCDGMQEEAHPTPCTKQGLATTLDASGQPTSVQLIS